VHHSPLGRHPFTLQIGDPNTVAARTGITTIADLRRYDMALGGQGAPLVPAFHNWLLRSATEPRVVVNIGGISNITTLIPDAPILGCDTGPGNTLLDAWIGRHRGQSFDAAGEWAAQGRVCEPLLGTLLEDPWFGRPMPKSTGRELFNLRWLEERLRSFTDLAPEDVQATLAELTAVSIAHAIQVAAPECQRLIVCGGGAYNEHLMKRLSARMQCKTESSLAHGAAPEWVEGLAFAWLARARLAGIPGNVPSVTGAHEHAVLGGIYSGSKNPGKNEQ
jgi:anhydro-N-acetylmuramic acid kinase